jgi:hypothetical protein
MRPDPHSLSRKPKPQPRARRRGGSVRFPYGYPRLANEAASAPRNATTTATAAAASASSAGSATSGAASAASAASATSGILLAGYYGVFLVEDVERPQAHVGDFFLTESELGGSRIPRRHIRGRHRGGGGCTARQRQRHPDGAHHRCDLFPSASLRSLPPTWHVVLPCVPANVSAFQRMFRRSPIHTPSCEQPARPIATPSPRYAAIRSAPAERGSSRNARRCGKFLRAMSLLALSWAHRYSPGTCHARIGFSSQR